MELLTESAGDAVLDMALSHALLESTARDGEAIARVYRPQPTLAFGRLDRLGPGIDRAAAAAAAHGFAPVLRLGGGRAAAYDQGAVVLELVTPSTTLGEGIAQRFDDGLAMLEAVLGGLGVAVRRGELAGEWCPGRWSLHLPDGPKVVGAAQRAVRGAALFTAVVIVEDAGRPREALEAVNDELRFAWDPETLGAIGDQTGLRAGELHAAVCAELSGARGAATRSVSEQELGRAGELRGQHTLRG